MGVNWSRHLKQGGLGARSEWGEGDMDGCGCVASRVITVVGAVRMDRSCTRRLRVKNENEEWM